MITRTLVLVSVVFELAMGIALVVLPQIVANALLNTSLDQNGLAFARLAGVALFCFGLTAWLGRAERPAYVGLLAYNWLAAGYIVILGLTLPATGPLLWPAGVAHVILAVLMLLRPGQPGH